MVSEAPASDLALGVTEVLESISDGFFACDHAQRFLYVNGAAERQLGKVRNDLIGKNLYDVFPELGSGDGIDAKLLRQAARTGEPIEREYYHPPSGHWFRGRVCPMPWGVAMYFHDVTRSRLTREALGASERQYRALIDSIDQGFCVIEMLFDAADRAVDYRYLEVNRAFEQQTGLVDPVGQRMRTLVPEHEQHWFETYGRVACTGEPVRFENAAKALNRWFDVYAFRVAPPEARRVAVLFKDVSQRKAIDEALRESEERFRVLVEGMAQAVWETDASGAPVADSPSWRELTGQSLEKWLAGGWVDAIHPDDRAEAQRQWLESLEQRKPLDIEYRVRTVDGSMRWSNDRAAPLFEADGTVRKWVGMNIDITERKRAEEALRDSDRRKDEFLAILAHELRNPLAPLRTGLEIMRLGKVEPERIERVRLMMARQVDHMVSLVDDLMDVSRISRGTIVLERQAVELATVIRSALEACDPIVRQRTHEVSLVMPAEAVYVDGDPHRLTQALGNLLTNAAKYTDPGGHIAITLKREANEAIVCVKDNGVGIREADLPSVFDLFMQVDSAIERTQGGLGIGLTIVRQLVELHGGTVEAHSEGPGKGSEFIVRLPLSNTPVEEIESRQAPRRGVRARRVLVVDDNEDAARAMATMLELIGHDVCVAHDGAEALAMAEARHPEVILMDLGMPNLNGYAAARKVRATDWGKSSLLIAVTGWGQQADRTASEQAGFDHHLVKPVEIDAVQRVVAQLDER